jgi:hypothetical protein
MLELALWSNFLPVSPKDKQLDDVLCPGPGSLAPVLAAAAVAAMNGDNANDGAAGQGERGINGEQRAVGNAGGDNNGGGGDEQQHAAAAAVHAAAAAAGMFAPAPGPPLNLHVHVPPAHGPGMAAAQALAQQNRRRPNEVRAAFHSSRNVSCLRAVTSCASCVSSSAERSRSPLILFHTACTQVTRL